MPSRKATSVVSTTKPAAIHTPSQPQSGNSGADGPA